MIASNLRCILCILITLNLAACSQEPPPPEPVTPRVKYFTVGEQATGQARRISGKLVASDTSLLSFGVAGTVDDVLVMQGSEVRDGQVLATLDAEPFRLILEQARAQLTISRAVATETRQNYDRILELFDRQVTTQAEVDTAYSNYQTARGNLQFAQSDLVRKERDLSMAELSAPFSGVIAARSIEPFQEVTVGTGIYYR